MVYPYSAVTQHRPVMDYGRQKVTMDSLSKRLNAGFLSDLLWFIIDWLCCVIMDSDSPAPDRLPQIIIGGQDSFGCPHSSLNFSVPA